MKNVMRNLYRFAIRAIPCLDPVYRTRGTKIPISLWSISAFSYRREPGLYRPNHAPSVAVDVQCVGAKNSLELIPDCSVQGSSDVIGEQVQAAPGVAIISSSRALTHQRDRLAWMIRLLDSTQHIVYRSAKEVHGLTTAGHSCRIENGMWI